MTLSTENTFRAVYRNFKNRNPSCDNIDILITVLNIELGIGGYSVTPSVITGIRDLNGFCVCYNNHKAFMPQRSVFNHPKTVFEYIGNILNEAEIITPNYIGYGVLGTLADGIKNASNKEDKLMLGERALTAMFPPEILSLLVTEHYPKFSALEQCIVQIRETTEAYCLGLYRSAITTLLPCIENAIRALGVQLNINQPENVGTQFFLSIYDAWLKYYIYDYMYRDYDWMPQSIRERKFFGGFDERFQIGLNGRNYFEKHLYQSSKKDIGLSKLNRHSILHGFMDEYHTKGNYLRLINLLNNICFMMTIAGESVSLFLPEKTEKYQAFYANLTVQERVGLNRAMFLDANSIAR
ncbi:hypothetical protein ACCX84_23090 [Pantoea trifolii]